jgi:formylglycine-generating enzyme required for sulfatase activity
MEDRNNHQPPDAIDKPAAEEKGAGDKISGDQVGGDKVQTQINSEGGNVFTGPVAAGRDVIGGDQIINIFQVERPEIEKPFDPRIEPQTVLVAAGVFLLGSEPGDEVPEHETPQVEVALGDFYIGRFPVTNRFYERYIRANKSADPPGYWFNRKSPEELLDHPVVDVSWFEAMAYCSWLSGETGRDYRLPGEAEWEKAASWSPDGRKRHYPWGDAWREGHCNVSGEGTSVVTAHKSGASAYGALDMLGNVQEWTRSAWGSSPNEPAFAYEDYDAEDGRMVNKAGDLEPQMRIVYRGGSYRSQPEEVSTTRRGNSAPRSKIAWRGFRINLIPHEQEQ